MTYFPKYLKNYPNMHSLFPFHLSLNHLINGFPAHRHDFLEFSYVVAGCGSETINGIHHPMDNPPNKRRKNSRWHIIHHIQRSYQEHLMLSDWQMCSQ